MIITKEIAGGFINLAAIVSNLFKNNFSPDPELLKVQNLINDIQGGLKKIKFWIEKEEDVKEEEFIKHVNTFSGLLGLLLLEIGYMMEEKKILRTLGRKLGRSGQETPVKWKRSFLRKREETVKRPRRVSFLERTEMKLDLVLNDFINYETQLEDIRCSVPDIKSSIPFSYMHVMRIKKLTDFHVSSFSDLAMQDPVDFGKRESISHSDAEKLVAYANIITTRSEIGTSNGMPKNKGSL